MSDEITMKLVNATDELNRLRADVERLREDRDSHQRIAITAMTRADKAEAALAKVREEIRALDSGAE